MCASAEPLLEVRGLVTRFPSEGRTLLAVDGVDFAVAQGQRLAIVGESGSGKSVTALSVLRLIDPPGETNADSLMFNGRDLRGLTGEEMRRLRGREIGFVMQDPLAALSPVFTVGEQIAETIRFHERVHRSEARERALELLAQVGIADPRVRAHEYPHQFSGGMRQRAAIAMALACSPKLLIADEPTTALDVTIQAQVLELLLAISAERGMAVILITHNLGVVAGFADVVAIMYAGRIVEYGAVEAIFERPCHPYTRALLACQPRLDRARGQLLAISGMPPSPFARPDGCAFHPRCSHRRGRERCVIDDPQLRPVVDADHPAACHFAEELVAVPAPEAILP